MLRSCRIASISSMTATCAIGRTNLEESRGAGFVEALLQLVHVSVARDEGFGVSCGVQCLGFRVRIL